MAGQGTKAFARWTFAGISAQVPTGPRLINRKAHQPLGRRKWKLVLVSAQNLRMGCPSVRFRALSPKQNPTPHID